MSKLATGQEVFYNRTGRKTDTFHPVTVEKSARKFTAIRFADGTSELVMTCTLWPALPKWATGETATASLTLAPSHNHFHGVSSRRQLPLRRGRRSRMSVLRHQISPLTTAQTEAVIKALIDAYYGEEQTSYSIADYVEMKGRLAEALDA